MLFSLPSCATPRVAQARRLLRSRAALFTIPCTPPTFLTFLSSATVGSTAERSRHVKTAHRAPTTQVMSASFRCRYVPMSVMFA